VTILITETEYGHVLIGIYVASGFLRREPYEKSLKWPGERENMEYRRVKWNKYFMRNMPKVIITVV
jgi:hypothetical protein